MSKPQEGEGKVGAGEPVVIEQEGKTLTLLHHRHDTMAACSACEIVRLREVAAAPEPPRRVGCETLGGNIVTHLESETCEVCAPEPQAASPARCPDCNAPARELHPKPDPLHDDVRVCQDAWHRAEKPHACHRDGNDGGCPGCAAERLDRDARGLPHYPTRREAPTERTPTAEERSRTGGHSHPQICGCGDVMICRSPLGEVIQAAEAAAEERGRAEGEKRALACHDCREYRTMVRAEGEKKGRADVWEEAAKTVDHYFTVYFSQSPGSKPVAQLMEVLRARAREDKP